MLQIEQLHATALCAGSCHDVAVESLVNAVLTAKQHHLALLEALASLQLVAIQAHMGLFSPDTKPRDGYEKLENPSIHPNNYFNFSKSLDEAAFNNAMAVVMTSGSLYDQARALLLNAKIKIRASKKQPEKLRRMVPELDRIKDIFSKIEAPHRVRDTLYLKVRHFLVLIYFVSYIC